MKKLYVYESDERRIQRINSMIDILEYHGISYTRRDNYIKVEDTEYIFKTIDDNESIRGMNFDNVIIEESVRL